MPNPVRRITVECLLPAVIGVAVFNAYGYITSFVVAGVVALVGVIPLLFYKPLPIDEAVIAGGMHG